MSWKLSILCLAFATSLARAAAPTAPAAAPRVLESLDIAPVWSGHPVGFALLTHDTTQYVAYYDDQRRLTVASRQLDSRTWTKQVLPTSVGWDSHNYIAIALDDNGDLHVAGNMHAVPLIYFRTTRPGDVTSLTRVDHMVDDNEETHCTYPVFFRGPGNQLLFAYRDGRSGNGNQVYNTYDPKSHTWRRLLDKPLTDGQGHRNAYLSGPTPGPDGLWHLVWVWRESPDCSTNHTLSYARSKDLLHWTKADGTPLPLPMTLTNADVVDPVPQHGGIINGNTLIGFDNQHRVVLTYHKFDSAGHTQLYNARFEDNHWKIYQTSDWSYRWDFSGGGSIQFEIHPGPVTPHSDGTLTQSFSHAKYGHHVWTLDPATLKPTATNPPPPGPDLGPVESPTPGMQPRTAGDTGHSPDPHTSYLLRWETLPVNRDQPRPGPPPPPSTLRLYTLRPAG